MEFSLQKENYDETWKLPYWNKIELNKTVHVTKFQDNIQDEIIGIENIFINGFISPVSLQCPKDFLSSSFQKLPLLTHIVRRNNKSFERRSRLYLN